MGTHTYLLFMVLILWGCGGGDTNNTATAPANTAEQGDDFGGESTDANSLLALDDQIAEGALDESVKKMAEAQVGLANVIESIEPDTSHVPPIPYDSLHLLYYLEDLVAFGYYRANNAQQWPQPNMEVSGEYDHDALSYPPVRSDYISPICFQCAHKFYLPVPGGNPAQEDYQDERYSPLLDFYQEFIRSSSYAVNSSEQAESSYFEYDETHSMWQSSIEDDIEMIDESIWDQIEVLAETVETNNGEDYGGIISDEVVAKVQPMLRDRQLTAEDFSLLSRFRDQAMSKATELRTTATDLRNQYNAVKASMSQDEQQFAERYLSIFGQDMAVWERFGNQIDQLIKLGIDQSSYRWLAILKHAYGTTGDELLNNKSLSQAQALTVALRSKYFAAVQAAATEFAQLRTNQ